MRAARRVRLRAAEGFTLIETLVTVLIVGILAGAAMPLLAAGRASAGDAPAIDLLHTAQGAAETVALDRGDYGAVSAAALRSADPTIATSRNAGAAAWVSTARGTSSGYTLTATSRATGNRFTIARAADGTLSRSCTIPSRSSLGGGCRSVRGTRGTW